VRSGTHSCPKLPHKTLFHEAAHVILGHTTEADFTDTERTPKNLREVEAEAVAMLCCEALKLEGADYCRGYIQNWLYPARRLVLAVGVRLAGFDLR
jgi:antirestriction protein ArdC